MTAPTPATAPAAAPVGIENFTRAETDTYMARLGSTVAVGTLRHRRELTLIDEQTVIRMNRDTLYSEGLFDLDAGPVTLTLPDAGQRYVSAQIVSQDHYTTAIHHGPGTYTLSRESVGTRYTYVIIRTLVDPASADDVRQVHAVQDAIRASQNGTGTLALPAWDPAGLQKMRDALIVLALTMPDSKRSFGTRDEVDPIRHLARTASGWGGLPEREALYLSRSAAQNDGQTIHRLTVRDVPVDGFWSVSVYNAQGFFEKNAEGAYTVNNLTAKRGSDGTIIVQFGGHTDDPNVNCLPVTPGWTYTVRLYRPRAEAVSGAWTLPPLQPLG